MKQVVAMTAALLIVSSLYLVSNSFDASSSKQDTDYNVIELPSPPKKETGNWDKQYVSFNLNNQRISWLFFLFLYIDRWRKDTIKSYYIKEDQCFYV
ncbi:hypothetical protein [Shouchella miscanthi]|uniref:Uncharacterized protein n=1 Tax=Shouchella miscanthi TaxID=2598861 RepID=A0ABU6NQ90_9BACI|nr:hypothetical protein [Shouchella miscanthi]